MPLMAAMTYRPARVARAVVQQPPQVLDAEGVLTDQPVLEVVDRPDGRLVRPDAVRLARAVQVLVGQDAQEHPVLAADVHGERLDVADLHGRGSEGDGQRALPSGLPGLCPLIYTERWAAARTLVKGVGPPLVCGPGSGDFAPRSVAMHEGREPSSSPGECVPEDSAVWDRRSFLRAAGAAGLLGGGRSTASAQADAPGAEGDLLIIDCHAHLYGADTAKYAPGTPAPLTPPEGTGTVEHLRRLTKEAGVRFVNCTQPRSYYGYDNRFTAETARANRDWMVGVVNLDPDDPGSPALLEKYVRDFNVRGLVSVPGKSGRFDSPVVVRLWEVSSQLGVVINLHITPREVEQVEAMLGRFPKVRVALDHTVNMTARNLDETLPAARRLAKHGNVHAKLSFLPTGSAEKYPFRDLHGPCREVIRAFGPERCVWGSNFPCELWCKNLRGEPSTYAQHLRLFTHELGLDRATREAILGKTAAALWRPGRPDSR
jgi:predicted TIM-barrel fold metal-dependent hydrolase